MGHVAEHMVVLPPKSRRQVLDWLQQPVGIAPLVSFRVLFGALMVFSTLRFWWLGWIDDHYVQPLLHFRYFGFEWVPILSAGWLYVIHALLVLAALGVMLGLFYRLSAVLLFLSFTYTELIDLTYYLNHYYFVSLVAFLLPWLPAHRAHSLDVRWRGVTAQVSAPRWTCLVLQLQVAIVYCYAGLAKINSDWLLHALPLRIWLPAHDQLPLIGSIFRYEFTAYLMSWAGMLYDCTIVGWLVWSRTRAVAYGSVLIFHLLTGLLFQIGVFPLVMSASALLFFSASWHQNVQRVVGRVMQWLVGRLRSSSHASPLVVGQPRLATVHLLTNARQGIVSGPVEWGRRWAFRQSSGRQLRAGCLVIFFAVQLLFPWRYLLYAGPVNWTESGYRFGWRVMLVEKAGTATFYVRDGHSGREGMVFNSDFLNAHQEKQMAFQPDLILQYAHWLRDYYAAQGVHKPQVRAEVYVTLNGRPSQLYFDTQLDLTTLHNGWQARHWLLPAPQTQAP